MIENIDKDQCVGCGICINSCWNDVIHMDEKENKAFIKYQEDCCSCNICKIDCIKNAITVSTKKRSIMYTSWGL